LIVETEGRLDEEIRDRNNAPTERNRLLPAFPEEGSTPTAYSRVLPSLRL